MHSYLHRTSYCWKCVVLDIMMAAGGRHSADSVYRWSRDTLRGLLSGRRGLPNKSWMVKSHRVWFSLQYYWTYICTLLLRSSGDLELDAINMLMTVTTSSCWISSQSRVLLVLTFKALNRLGPSYLWTTCSFWSSSRSLLQLPGPKIV